MWRKTRAETSSQTYERGLLGLLSPPDLPADCMELPMRLYVPGKREKVMQQELEAMDIQTTSSCNLLCLQGLPVLDLTYHFHLTVEGCCAHPALWVREYSVDDRKLRQHDGFIAHGETYCLYQVQQHAKRWCSKGEKVSIPEDSRALLTPQATTPRLESLISGLISVHLA